MRTNWDVDEFDMDDDDDDDDLLINNGNLKKKKVISKMYVCIGGIVIFIVVLATLTAAYFEGYLTSNHDRHDDLTLTTISPTATSPKATFMFFSTFITSVGAKSIVFSEGTLGRATSGWFFNISWENSTEVRQIVSINFTTITFNVYLTNAYPIGSQIILSQTDPVGNWSCVHFPYPISPPCENTYLSLYPCISRSSCNFGTAPNRAIAAFAQGLYYMFFFFFFWL